MRCKISATSEASAANKNLANKYLQFSFFCSSLTKKNVIKIDKRDIFFLFRRSRPEVFYKKNVLRNFAKFTGKHLRQSLYFNKVAGRLPTLFKKWLWHRCFPVHFAKFLATPFFIEQLRWLLLSFLTDYFF